MHVNLPPRPRPRPRTPAPRFGFRIPINKPVYCRELKRFTRYRYASTIVLYYLFAWPRLHPIDCTLMEKGSCGAPRSWPGMHVAHADHPWLQPVAKRHATGQRSFDDLAVERINQRVGWREEDARSCARLASKSERDDALIAGARHASLGSVRVG